MAILNTTASFIATAGFTLSQSQEHDSTITLSVTASLSETSGSTTLVVSMRATASLTATAEIVEGVKSSSGAGSFLFRFRGRLIAQTPRIIITQSTTGTVNNIEDLPVSPADGTVYNVIGTAANREQIIAVYRGGSWFYQLSQNTIKMTNVNPLIGTNITMPNFVNFLGVPNVPQYWDKMNTTGSVAYSLELIPVAPSIPTSEGGGTGSNVVWRWKVEDLADPGTGQYSLNSWPAHNGVGPTWYSKSFYRPQVKGTVKFNIKKNKTRKQRSVTFNNEAVDHIWMTCSSLPQPFTVIIAGIIHSYPTAKFGHYLLDSGTEPADGFDANKTGKDFFPEEGTNPRNVMLFQKTRARIACNVQPNKDLKVIDKSIKIKHTEKARPRMFYGVFNGGSSRIGTMDKKYKFDGTGALTDHGGSTHFNIGRRVNRISDNRASKMSIWDIAIFHRALSIDEITNYYQEISNYYQFKEYE